MKREARGYEARCPELDPGLMTVLDLEGAEYPGEYWADGVKIKVSVETSNVNFLFVSMLGACITDILLAPDRRIQDH